MPALISITCWWRQCICVFINIFSACGHLTLRGDHQFLVTARQPRDSKWTVKIAWNSIHLPPPWVNICISFWCSWAMARLQSHFQVSEHPASTLLIMQKKKISALWTSLPWERHMHFYLTYSKIAKQLLENCLEWHQIQNDRHSIDVIFGAWKRTEYKHGRLLNPDTFASSFCQWIILAGEQKGTWGPLSSISFPLSPNNRLLHILPPCLRSKPVGSQCPNHYSHTWGRVRVACEVGQFRKQTMQGRF